MLPKLIHALKKTYISIYYCNDVIKLIRHFAKRILNDKNIAKTKIDSTLKLTH